MVATRINVHTDIVGFVALHLMIHMLRSGSKGYVC